MILVTGATGNVGRRVVAQLARAGEPVRAWIRDPQRAAEFEALGVDAFVGDLTRPGERAAALTGVRAVIACHSAIHGGGVADLHEVDGVATVALAAAAQGAGVERFVLLSYLGAEHLRSGGARFAAKHQAELALRQQEEMGYAILRLCPLMSELTALPAVGNPGLSGGFLLFGPGQARISPVSPEDAARAAVAALRAADRRLVLAVGGPETYAWNELPRALEATYERPVVVWRLGLWLLRVARVLVGLLSRDAADRLRWYESLLTTDFAADPALLVEHFGFVPEDLASYLRREEGAPHVVAETGAPPVVEEAPDRVVEPHAEPEPAAPAAEFEAPLREPEQPPVAEPGPPDEPAPGRAIEAPAPPPVPLTPEPDTRELPAEPDDEPDLEPEPKSEPAIEPEPEPAHAPEPEPAAEPEPLAAADEWGTHGEYEAPAHEPEPTGKRPPVSRPQHVDAHVVDPEE